MQIEARAVTF
ncbi:hypothetical protein GQ600_9913 [Phytophthora cactorum]|nr:hypothetical protein GQ600_9913 [Phytophthora cactorum]